MENILQVGVITSTHGIKGEVKVFPTTDDAQRFKKLKEVLIDMGKEYVTLEIEGIKFFKKFVILKFKGIENINDAEQYRQKGLWITREHAVKLRKNEYFITDLIDMRVFTEDGKEFGVLTDVMQTGANDVYIVKTPENREVLIPAIKQCILNVNVEEKRMDIYLIPGLV